MKYLAALSILLLGCESSPRVIEKPVYVDVPLVKPCVRSIPAEPEYETSRLTAADDTDTVATAYMVEREQRKIYIKQLQSKLAGCVPPHRLGPSPESKSYGDEARGLSLITQRVGGL